MPPGRKPPYKSKPRRSGCQVHCYIWCGKGDDGMFTVACAHCPAVSKKVDVGATYDSALLDKQIASSRDGHRRVCRRAMNGR